jgi:hypothetical protein
MFLVIPRHPLMIAHGPVPIGVGDLLDLFIDASEAALPKMGALSHMTTPLSDLGLHQVPHHLRYMRQLRLEECLGPNVPSVWQIAQPHRWSCIALILGSRSIKNYYEYEKCNTPLYQQVGMGCKGMVKLTFPFVDLPPCMAYSPHEYTTSIQSLYDQLPENWAT